MSLSCHDVCAYIVEQAGRTDTVRVHKLMYLSEAFSLVWDSCSLFDERIEAWANGPVVRELFERSRGHATIGSWRRWGDPSRLSTDQRETVDAVLAAYGHLNGYQLAALTASQRPFLEAREGLAPGDRSDAAIDRFIMCDYFGGIYHAQQRAAAGQ